MADDSPTRTVSVYLLREHVKEPADALNVVLLVKASKRLFALTFGSGRHLLEYGAYERNFGLRVALNLVDPDQIRSAQSRTFVDTALQILEARQMRWSARKSLSTGPSATPP